MKNFVIIMLLLFAGVIAKAQTTDTTRKAVDYEYAMGYISTRLPSVDGSVDMYYDAIIQFTVIYENGIIKKFDNKDLLKNIEPSKKKAIGYMFLMDVFNKMEKDGYELFTTFSDAKGGAGITNSYFECVFRRVKR